MKYVTVFFFFACFHFLHLMTMLEIDSSLSLSHSHTRTHIANNRQLVKNSVWHFRCNEVRVIYKNEQQMHILHTNGSCLSCLFFVHFTAERNEYECVEINSVQIVMFMACQYTHFISILCGYCRVQMQLRVQKARIERKNMKVCRGVFKLNCEKIHVNEASCPLPINFRLLDKRNFRWVMGKSTISILVISPKHRKCRNLFLTLI